MHYPLGTRLPLDQVLIMPSLSVLRGPTWYRPVQYNCLRLAIRECEVAGPYLASKGCTFATRLPSTLPLEYTARRDIDAHIITIKRGAVKWTFRRPYIADSGVMND